MGGGNAAAQRHAEARAALGAGAGLVGAVERLADMRKRLGVHTAAVVGHGQHTAAVRPRGGAQRHMAARRAGFDAVVAQVDGQAFQQRGFAPDGRRLPRRTFQRHAARFGPGGGRGGGPAQQRGRVDARARQRFMRQRRQPHKLVGQTQQPPALEPDGLERLIQRFAAHVGALDELGIAADGGQRRAHLVRKVVHQALLGRGFGLQRAQLRLHPPGHLVQHAAQLADFVAARRRAGGQRAAVIVPGRKGAGGLGQRAQRAVHAAQHGVQPGREHRADPGPGPGERRTGALPVGVKILDVSLHRHGVAGQLPGQGGGGVKQVPPAHHAHLPAAQPGFERSGFGQRVQRQVVVARRAAVPHRQGQALAPGVQAGVLPQHAQGFRPGRQHGGHIVGQRHGQRVLARQQLAGAGGKALAAAELEHAEKPGAQPAQKQGQRSQVGFLPV